MNAASTFCTCGNWDPERLRQSSALHNSRVTSHIVFHSDGDSWSCAGLRNTFKVIEVVRESELEDRHFNSKILSMPHETPGSSVFFHRSHWYSTETRGIGGVGREP